MASRNIILFYDADCGFCQFTANWLIKDAILNIDLIKYQDEIQVKKFNLLNKDVINKKIQLIQKKYIFSGAKAVAICLKNKNFKIYKIIGNIILLPFVLPFAEICYTIIARNRIMISKFLKLNHCKINYI